MKKTLVFIFLSFLLLMTACSNGIAEESTQASIPGSATDTKASSTAVTSSIPESSHAPETSVPETTTVEETTEFEVDPADYPNATIHHEDGMAWVLSEDGTELTILGEGKISGGSWNADIAASLKIQRLIIGEGITEIEAGRGYDFAPHNITEARLPKSLKVIGANAFVHCRNLTSVVIPEGVEEIGQAGLGYSGLKSIEIPASVKKIGVQGLAHCVQLEKVTLSPGLETVERNAFEGCELLKTLEIPEGVLELNEMFICKCTGLESVVLPKSLTSIGKHFCFGCKPEIDILYMGSPAMWVELGMPLYEQVRFGM